MQSCYTKLWLAWSDGWNIVVFWRKETKQNLWKGQCVISLVMGLAPRLALVLLLEGIWITCVPSLYPGEICLENASCSSRDHSVHTAKHLGVLQTILKPCTTGVILPARTRAKVIISCSNFSNICRSGLFCDCDKQWVWFSNLNYSLQTIKLDCFDHEIKCSLLCALLISQFSTTKMLCIQTRYIAYSKLPTATTNPATQRKKR